MQDRPSLVPAHMKGKLHIGAALEGKVRAGGAYREFVAAVVSACSSSAAEPLEITEYSLDEKRDLENPRWLKVILQVDFADGDFDSKRARRIRLRGMINERIRGARLGSDAPEAINDLTGRFFIIVRW